MEEHQPVVEYTGNLHRLSGVFQAVVKKGGSKMRKSTLARSIILLLAAVSLSSCVVMPYDWDDGGYGRHDRGWHGGWRHGGDRGYHH
jgi:hypothetical protein